MHYDKTRDKRRNTDNVVAQRGTPVSVKLGFTKGQIIQEFYLDDDADQSLRQLAEEDVVDGTIVWWRAEDAEEEDLADLLVDAMSNLDDGGLIWVLIPKPGRPGAVPVSDVEEAAHTAGLHATSASALAPEWAGIRLTARSRKH